MTAVAPAPSSTRLTLPRTGAGRRVLLVGAGLAGSLLACYLAEMGYSVAVYERRPDPRAKGYIGGRSINLALSARGLHALAGIGLDRVVMEKDAIPMPGRMIHARDGALKFQPYSKNPGDAINSVSRGGLNLTLLNEAARHENVSLTFDHFCTDADLAKPSATFSRPDGSTVKVEADLILGTDGAFSAARGVLQKTDRFDYSQSYLQHGYKELHIPPSPAGTEAASKHIGYAMDPAALHIWPRGGSMMIALPNRDKSFTCTLFWPFSGEHGLESLRTPQEITSFFTQHYPDAVPLMPTLVHDYTTNPNSSLVTVRCWPWQWGGKVVLVGDAAHAIVPFYGQGMNCAFEDVVELAACLGRHPQDPAAALDAYQRTRKPNSDAIADMALENFVEMRDKVGRPEFLYKKRVEQAVHAMFPSRVEPQYNLVSFSTVPYVEARRRGAELDCLLDRVIAAVPMDKAAAMSQQDWETAIRATAQ